MFVPCTTCGNAMYANEPCPHCGNTKVSADRRFSTGTHDPESNTSTPRQQAAAPPAPSTIVPCPSCGNARLEKESCPHCGAEPKPSANNRFAKGTRATETSTPASTEPFEKMFAMVALAVGILALVGGIYVFAVVGSKPAPTLLSTTGEVKTTIKKNPDGSVWYGHYSTNIHYMVNGSGYEIPAQKEKDGTKFTVYYPSDRPASGSTSVSTTNHARLLGGGFAVVGLIVSAIAGLILSRNSG